MSTGLGVLFAAIVVLVVAVVAWLVLRGRDSSGASVADPSGPSGVSNPSAADAADAADVAAAREPGNLLDPSDSHDDSTDLHERDPGEGDVPDAQLQAEGAEFDGDGLSVLDSDDSDPGEVSGSAPRTPTEAFGEAQGAAHVSAPAEETVSGSLLDDPGSDSTPLFRSMRERLMASAETPVEAAPTEEAAPVGPHESAGSPGSVRRVSELDEVVDGGFGIGSAAPIDDGAQPLGHPIKGELGSRTYRDLHSASYETADPDVWFLDPGFAERAGFRRVD